MFLVIKKYVSLPRIIVSKGMCEGMVVESGGARNSLIDNGFIKSKENRFLRMNRDEF